MLKRKTEKRMENIASTNLERSLLRPVSSGLTSVENRLLRPGNCTSISSLLSTSPGLNGLDSITSGVKNVNKIVLRSNERVKKDTRIGFSVTARNKPRDDHLKTGRNLHPEIKVKDKKDSDINAGIIVKDWRFDPEAMESSFEAASTTSHIGWEEEMVSTESGERSKRISYMKCLPLSESSSTFQSYLFSDFKAMSLDETGKTKFPKTLQKNLIQKFLEFDEYQLDPTDYIRAGLEGVWDPSQSGRRMRLAIPFTWETELSEKGNNCETWTLLITSGKLPYMAMLRNLRNIIRSGIPSHLHDKVSRNLCDKRAVMKGKQLPFRYLTAHVIIDELKRKLLYRNYLEKVWDKDVKKPKKGKKLKKYTRTKEMTHNELEYPLFIWTIQNLAEISTSGKYNFTSPSPAIEKPAKYSTDTLELYQKSLNLALEISIRQNLAPISGSTLIICSQLGDNSNELKATGLGSNIRAVGVLLSLMCSTRCESSSVYVSYGRVGNLKSLEQCVASNKHKHSDLLTRAKALCDSAGFDTVFVLGPMLPSVAHYVNNCCRFLGHVNAVWNNLTRTERWPEDAGDPHTWTRFDGATDLVLRYVAEASDQHLLEHVERIDEVYGLDTLPSIRVPNNVKKNSQLLAVTQIERPLPTWRCCRVFVSSTFRDMHAERDMICGLLFPALRKFAAHELRVHLNEVDLRWGVPESATRNPQALQLCLEQVLRADLFVLLIGDRYGWVPKQALVNALPKPILSWINKFHNPGMSCTEIEYHLIKRVIQQRMPAQSKRAGLGAIREEVMKHVFAFVRNPSCLQDIPDATKLEFVEQHATKRERLSAFKRLIGKDGVVINNFYSASFNGWFGGRPVMGNLTHFGQELHTCLQKSMSDIYLKSKEPSMNAQVVPGTPLSILETFVEPVANAISPRQLVQLETSISEMTERGKQCNMIRSFAKWKTSTGAKSNQPNSKDTDIDGTILLITGSAGCGKTTYLAASTMTLHQAGWNPRRLENLEPPETTSLTRRSNSSSIPTVTSSRRPKLMQYTVFPYFVDGLSLTGLSSSNQLHSLLSSWMKLITETVERTATLAGMQQQVASIMKTARATSDLGSDVEMKCLHDCFTRLLTLLVMFTDMRFVFILDAADHLQPQSIDWIPNVLPRNVQFIISCDVNSSMARDLSTRPDCLALTVSGLNPSERAAAIRSLFGQYGKVLKESAFGNQLSMLVNKRNAELPLYLRLACDELRLYGSFEELDYQLRSLPDTVPKMVQHVIARVEVESGSELALTALALMCCAQRPLAITELQRLLNAWLANRHQTGASEVSNRETGWAQLDENPCDLSKNLTTLIEREKCVQHLLQSTAKPAERPVLPALALHILLAGLRPLLASSGEELDNEDEGDETSSSAVNLHQVPRGWIRFRSTEVAQLVSNEVFNSPSRLAAHKRLGYQSITLSDKSKRLKMTSTDAMVTVDERYIHWLLASELSSLENKIYHFFLAGKKNIVYNLLTSAAFLVEEFEAGLGHSIFEQFHGYGSNGAEIQSEWDQFYKQTPLVQDRLKAMSSFIGRHNGTLTRYPFLFGQLAINCSQHNWIRMLGQVRLTLLPDLGDSVGSVAKHFVRHLSATTDASLLSPCAIHPISSTTFGGDSPTWLTTSPDGLMLAYGTRHGIVKLVELSTWRELRSLLGHSDAVLSGLFIPVERKSNTHSLMTENTNQSTQHTDYWLVSTAQDASIYIWFIHPTEDIRGRVQLTDASRLASLTGRHQGAVTCCAWHPGNHVLATGGLDCLVILWTLPKTTEELLNVTQRGNNISLPFRMLFTGSGLVSSVAFRLPIGAEKQGRMDIFDAVAIGCWDGTVRIRCAVSFSMERPRTLNVSKAAISSVAYSPNGGSMLATQDVNGRLFIWSSENYSLLSGYTQADSLNLSQALTTNCQHGQLCYTQPDGRYLLQSTSAGSQNGQISVWNAQLGARRDTWKSSKDWSSKPNMLGQVTAFCVDPFGHLFFAGSNKGSFVIGCTKTGCVLWNSSQTTDGGELQKTCVQSIACSLVRGKKTYESYILLFVVGYASGVVLVYSCQVSMRHVLSVPGKCTCQMNTPPIQILKQFCHANDNGTDYSTVSADGGTLCVSTGGLVTASGGGDASCWVMQFDLDEYGNVSKRLDGQHKYSEFDAAVTAVAVDDRWLAVGTKNRVIKIFRRTGDSLIFSMTDEDDTICNDWVTSLAWGQIIKRRGHRTYRSLMAGSNDQCAYCCCVTHGGNIPGSEELPGPGGAVTTVNIKGNLIVAGSMEGAVNVWRINDGSHSELLTRIDCTSGSNDVTDGNMRILNVGLYSEHNIEQKDDIGQSKLKPRKRKSQDDTIGFALPERLEAKESVDVDMDNESPSPKASNSISQLKPINTTEKSDSDSDLCSQSDLDSDSYSQSDSDSDSSNSPHDSNKNEDKRDNKNSCLFTAYGKQEIMANEHASEAVKFRLLIGQQIQSNRPNKVGGTGSQQFRYRSLAPLQLDCVAHLGGHAGLMASHIVAHQPDGLKESLESVVVTLAQKRSKSIVETEVGSDIRLWKLPRNLGETGLADHRMQHDGPITCLERLKSTITEGWCISGGADGSLIIWKPHGQMHTNTTLETNFKTDRAITWAPRLRIQCTTLPISALCTEIWSGRLIIYAAAGVRIWKMTLPINETFISEMTSLSMNLDELNQKLTTTSNRDLCGIDKFLAQNVVIDLCPIPYNKSGKTPHGSFDLLASLSNGRFLVLPFASDITKIRTWSFAPDEVFPADAVFDGVWSTSWHCFDGRNVGLHGGTPVSLVRNTLELEQSMMERLFSPTALCLSESINFIEPLGKLNWKDEDKEVHLIITKSESCFRVKLIGINGKTIAQSEPVRQPITAVCGLHVAPVSGASPNLASTMPILMATADGVLHLLQIKVDAPDNQLERIALCPTGERICHVLLLTEQPLRVAVGLENGKLEVFTIM